MGWWIEEGDMVRKGVAVAVADRQGMVEQIGFVLVEGGQFVQGDQVGPVDPAEIARWQDRFDGF